MFILFTDANIFPLKASLEESRLKRNAFFVVGGILSWEYYKLWGFCFLLFCKIKWILS